MIIIYTIIDYQWIIKNNMSYYKTSDFKQKAIKEQQEHKKELTITIIIVILCSIGIYWAI